MWLCEDWGAISARSQLVDHFQISIAMGVVLARSEATKQSADYEEIALLRSTRLWKTSD